MIIDCIREYFKTCPLLKKGKINVNYLGEQPVAYTIEQVPSDPMIKRYSDGASQRQCLFVFASREYYDNDVLGNMDMAKFYEELAEWVEGQSEAGVLPVLGEGYQSLDMRTNTSGYLMSADAQTARFQIQMRLIYYKSAM